MTISTQGRIVTYIGNNSTTIFPFTFPVRESVHLSVRLYLIADGTYITLAPGAYTVTGVGPDSSGGSVTYNPSGTPIAPTHMLAIYRTVPYTQDMDIFNQSGFYPEVLEDQLDKIVMQIQQLADEVSRAVLIPPTTTMTGEEFLALLNSAEANADRAEQALADAVAMIVPDAGVTWPKLAPALIADAADVLAGNPELLVTADVLEEVLPSADSITIQCTATYDVDGSGFGNYRLTAINGQPIPITNGITVAFVPPATAVVGAMYIWTDGVQRGFLYNPSGSRRATFQDVRKSQPVRLRYQGAIGTDRPAGFVIDTPQGSFAHSLIGAHGKFSLTSDFTNGIVRLQGWDGGYGTMLVKNPLTGELCMTDGPMMQNIFNGTAWVNGVPNQSCLGNTFYYIYVFMPDGSDPYTRLFDFDQTLPTSNYLGILKKQTDDSRMLAGYMYTFDGDISFRTTGVKPTLAVQNLYNGMLLHMTSDMQANYSGIGASWTDYPNAACRITTNAETNLPHFEGHCNFIGVTSGVAEFRLKLTGIDAQTGTPFTQYTQPARATVNAGEWVNVSVSFGAALSTGTLVVTPQVQYITGNGGAECWVFGDCYQ